MAKYGWVLLLSPLLFGSVYLTWQAGFQRGYEKGQDETWRVAHGVIRPQHERLVSANRSGR